MVAAFIIFLDKLYLDSPSEYFPMNNNNSISWINSYLPGTFIFPFPSCWEGGQEVKKLDNTKRI